MKKFNFFRGVFLIISVLVILTGIFIPSIDLVHSVMGFLMILALVILDKNADKTVNLSRNNAKVKTTKFVTRFNIILITFMIILSISQSYNGYFSKETIDILTILFVTVIILILGNIAPKIPFNRYTGLRLPWTVRDEETWNVAHRVLGYVSFPIVFIMVITSFYFEMEMVSSICTITWILIPAIYSLYFYYKKMKKFVN